MTESTSSSTTGSHEELIQTVEAQLREQGVSDPEFVRRFYKYVPVEELSVRPVETLVGAARSHREFAEHRPPGTANVRVFNATTETDGWTSPRTTVLVVTDDMPFLVDSVTGVLVSSGYDIHLVIHPQLTVRRDAVGDLLGIDTGASEATDSTDSAGTIAESWMLLSIDRESDADQREALVARIRSALEDVRVAVEDWKKMRTKCLVIAAELEGAVPAGTDPAESTRAAQFLNWLADNHFTFLGYREYALEQVEGGETITSLPGTGLGILRSDQRATGSPVLLSEEARVQAHARELLVLTKANSRSTVHRNAYLDYIGVKKFDAAGEVVGEARFVGLFASTAYTESVSRIPMVADKVHDVVARSGVAADSHTGKDLIGVLETYPRDELFHASTDELFASAMAVTQLQERRRTKLLVREDAFGRFVSCLVYIPRDRYNTAVRTRMADLLKDAFDGESVEFTARVSESALSRLQFVVRMPSGKRVRHLSEQERLTLEERLVELSRTWNDRLGDGVRSTLGEVEGDRLIHAFGRGFPTAYEETFTINQGLADLRHLDRLGEDAHTRVALYRPAGSPDDIRRFKLFRIDPLSLTEILPIFTHMGVEVVDERPYEVTRSDGQQLHVYDFGLRVPDAAIWESHAHEDLRDLFEGAVFAVWSGQAESDNLNRLVLGAHLTWRQVVILRTIARYLRQARSAFSPDYIEGALVANPDIARSLVHLFEARFDPALGAALDPRREEAQAEQVAAIESALDGVASLDHDRIIRSFLGVIQAALRTNFYQRPTGAGEDEKASQYKAFVSLKLNPKAVPDLPAPRPEFEIWVYGPRVEGVHLRFGPVARGGLRWSDRREDFRTEVLGLVKAQMVKNSVIVPTGSKGGFYAKQLPDPAVDRDAWLAEGIEAYKLFISGLLDLTDNRVEGAIVPPADVVRHDPDDPYLVVAADKGTASFSDIANGVSQAYGFWLDDAFASGGSAGYDHKGMGITARGAWESVKRHFREMAVDTQTEDFTAVGIGDMSGDVFGNGMLLSEHIRLVAAFDHRHVFVDPNPVAAPSFAERRRLFDLPRSSWADYDTSLISEGGGVWARDLKSIPVSDPMREALGLAKGTTSITPTDLLAAILRAPVDLLWNGGIGTYVKASTESNADVGDRANDAIRADGGQLRVKVVGEGGNLGLSQLGRIEAAQNGVRVNTDAIDNSAGVDTSDHEVNIKILLGDLVRAGGLDLEQRNEFLASMTDEVAAQVLRDNYEQNVLLGNARAQEASMVTVHERLIDWLEDNADLDRALEFLPSPSAMEARREAHQGLKSPEFAVLVAYAKLSLKAALLAGELPDDPWFASTLAGYFPEPIRERYAEELAQHPLRREIVVNSVANSIVNRGGITFVFRSIEETGATPEQVARAFVAAREIFGLGDYVREVEALDNVVSTETQTELYLEFRRLLDRATRWFLSARPSRLDIAAEIERFAGPATVLRGQVGDLLRGTELERLQRRIKDFEDKGVPAALAARAAGLLDEYSVLDIVDLASETEESPERIAPLYYFVSERFGIDSMLSRVTKLPREDQWDALARGAVRDDLYSVLEGLTRSVIDASSPQDEPAARFESWAGVNSESVHRAKRALAGISRLERPNLAAVSVALRTLRTVARSGSGSTAAES